MKFVIGVLLSFVVGILVFPIDSLLLTVLGSLGVGLLFELVHKIWLLRSERRSRRNAAELQRQQVLANIKHYSKEFNKVLNQMPELLQQAEIGIETASRDFEEGAFAPFWDSVERATKHLAQYEVNSQSLIAYANAHQQATSVTGAWLPPLRIPTATLPDPRPTLERLNQMVRRAQRDFQFATIYEQRKTHQILIAGFTTLGQAINDLGDIFNTSLSNLASTMSCSLSEMLSTQQSFALYQMADDRLKGQQLEDIKSRLSPR